MSDLGSDYEEEEQGPYLGVRICAIYNQCVYDHIIIVFGYHWGQRKDFTTRRFCRIKV